MTQKFRHFLIRSAYLIIDLVCICLAIYLACLFRPGTISFEPTFYNVFFSPRNPYRFVFAFWIVTTILLLKSNELYQTKREVLEVYEIGLIIKSVLIASLLVVVANYGLRIQDFPRSVMLIGSTLIMFFLSIWRILKRIFVEHLVSKGYNNFNVLIVGAGRVGQSLKREIQKRPGLGLKVVGFLDDYKVDGTAGKGIKILGKIEDFRKIAKHEFIHEVFITVHHDSEAFLKILGEAREMGMAIRVIPQGYHLVSGEFSKFNIGIIPVLEYSDVIPLRIQVGKRVFDILISLFALVILSPLFLFFGLLIKLDSRGSIFYVSRRYGRNGRIINMIKFRSMCNDADRLHEEINNRNEVDGPIFKMRKDPRITNVGKVLRKYSLDELPQFVNVLLGEMSLVGPRPLPIDQIEKEDLKQLKRLEVRPGITGLWQIRGRSDISFSRLIKWDMWYINNWSLWLDFNILLQTIPVVLKGKGAY